MAKYELRIETSELKKALDVLVTTINRKNALPIMSDVRIGYSREKKMFTLLGSNTEQWIELDAPWILLDKDDKAEPFDAVCVNALALKEAFGALPSLPAIVTIDMKELSMQVNYGKGDFTMPVELANEYPMPKKVSDTDMKVKFSIPTQKLLPKISAARCCVAADELRPVMCAVCVDVWHDHCVVVASNGHTLYKHSIDTGMGWLEKGNFQADASEKLLLPSPALTPIIKTLAATEQITLTADNQRIVLEAEGVQVGTATPDGNFPNYNSVIPREQKYVVNLDKAEMMVALRRVSIFSNESSNLVVLHRVEGQMQLQAADIDFGRNANESVTIINDDCQLPDGFKIGCKISNLLELLQCISTDNVRLKMIDQSRPMLLFDDDEKSALTLLIMPMLVNV